MRLTVNGETRDTEARTLAALWVAETEHLEPPSRKGFAIARNGELVRAAQWDETRIEDGDRVEIIRAVAGG
jgi:sulfur carrier protein